MEDSRKPHYTVGTNGIQKEAGTAKKKWIDDNIVRRDLKDLQTLHGMKTKNWRQTAEWRQRMAQCIHLDTE